MNDIKSIKFAESDEDILKQEGFVKIKPFQFRDAHSKGAETFLLGLSSIIETEEGKIEDSGVTFKGTSRSLEDLLKVNKIAYTLLEREVIIEDIKIPQIIFTTLSFGSLISGIMALLIYYIKDVYLFNPFISIIIIIGSIGWLATAIATFRIRRK